MRVPLRDWRVWVMASMSLLRLYTVSAVSWLIIWHTILLHSVPPYKPFHPDIIAAGRWVEAFYHFRTVAGVIRCGYFLAAFILVVGGLVLWLRHFHKSATWSFIFGLGALGIGFWLRDYSQ